jgi:hypothetical protein
MERSKRFGVYFIFKSMEVGPSFRISNPKYPTKDPNYRIIAPQKSRYTHIYFYIRDEVVGPMVMCVGTFPWALAKSDRVALSRSDRDRERGSERDRKASVSIIHAGGVRVVVSEDVGGLGRLTLGEQALEFEAEVEEVVGVGVGSEELVDHGDEVGE